MNFKNIIILIIRPKMPVGKISLLHELNSSKIFLDQNDIGSENNLPIPFVPGSKGGKIQNEIFLLISKPNSL